MAQGLSWSGSILAWEGLCPLIAIVDYGMGNLRSVWKAFHHLGADARLTNEPKDVARADAVVLPGVGAFQDCMANLVRLGLDRPIIDAIQQGKPYLGICLGLQILFQESEEFGCTPGLGVLEGRVERFQVDAQTHQGTKLKVPHMGWNSLRIVRRAPHLDGIPEGSYYYFVHSFYVKPKEPEIVASFTEYGTEFASSIWKGNLFPCQFHPEKSQDVGLTLLDNFLRIV
jgi:imidazole glycerol-phosphate synthase subunit HisH